MELLENLPVLLKTFWYIAIPTSLIFAIQAVMTFSGVDSSDGLQADFDGDLEGGDSTFQLFSLRNLINFLLGFSWSGISLYNSIENSSLLIALAVIIGCLFVFVFFLIIKQVQKLEEDNSFKLENTLHQSAEVYLTIPENKSGKGKIMISINGAFHELDAMTEHVEKIASGSTVKVVKIENNNIIIVQPI
ncbi:NfeD family protein [Flavobacterium pokkalii]|nr:NfeD family protein [Flavobacterium pokkalii]